MENKEETNINNKIRNSNIELLRIIAIVMIVIHHMAQNNLIYINGTIANKSLGVILLGIGQIGVSIFILITGYFQITKDFRSEKILKLWLQVLFYSVIIWILCIKLNIINVSKENLIGAIFPISYNQYWFISSYLILYIFSPFINKFAKSFGQREYKNFLLVFATIFSIMYSVLYNSRGYSIGMRNPWIYILVRVFIFISGIYSIIWHSSFGKQKNTLWGNYNNIYCFFHNTNSIYQYRKLRCIFWVYETKFMFCTYYIGFNILYI